MTELEQIMAAFSPLNVTAPVLSRSASGRLPDPQVDADARSKKTKEGLEGQTGLILSALFGGGLNLGKALAGFLGPAVNVSAIGPGLRATAGQPFKTGEQIGVQDQLWKAGNLPWQTPSPGPPATGVMKPSAEVIPIRKSLPKGNIRPRTEDETLAAIEGQWDKMTKGISDLKVTPTASNNEMIKILRGLTLVPK